MSTCVSLTGRFSAVVLALAGVVSDLRKDGAYAVRTLVKSRSFATVGVLSLALSIGVSALYFAQVNALVLRTLPGATDPDRLVATQAPVSFPDFERFREQRSVATRVAAFIGPVPFSVALEGAEDGAQRVFGHIVSPEYFVTLGVAPVAGRLFQPDLEMPGSAPVVVVSERFWRTRMDADPNAVGRPLRVNGQSATIIGIGPKDFLGVYPINPADLFVPVTAGASMAPELGDDALGSDRESFRVVLRLAGGETVAAAEAALDVATANPDQEARGLDDARSSASGSDGRCACSRPAVWRLYLPNNGRSCSGRTSCCWPSCCRWRAAIWPASCSPVRSGAVAKSRFDSRSVQVAAAWCGSS